MGLKPGPSCRTEGVKSQEREEEKESNGSAAEQCFQQKEKTGKPAPGRVSPLPGYDGGDGSGSPGVELAVAAIKIFIHQIIDTYSHHLSCHLNRQLNNSQFYFPTLVFRRSVNLKDVRFPSFYVTLCFLI